MAPCRLDQGLNVEVACNCPVGKTGGVIELIGVSLTSAVGVIVGVEVGVGVSVAEGVGLVCGVGVVDGVREGGKVSVTTTAVGLLSSVSAGAAVLSTAGTLLGDGWLVLVSRGIGVGDGATAAMCVWVAATNNCVARTF